MKLLGYVINGGTMGKDIFSCTTEQLNGNDIWIFSNDITIGYSDITSIETVYKYGLKTNKDYKFVRNEILNLVWGKMLGDPSNWNNLNLEEKKIASEFFVVPKILRDTVYTTDEQIPMAENFDINSIESRKIRFNKAKYQIYNRLTTEQANIILNEVEKDNLSNLYIQYGREGTIEGDPEGFFDYILSRTGTSYENNGFINHDYSPIGFNNMLELANFIIDIVKNGNY